MLNAIGHNSISLADGVVKLGQSSASAYRRTLIESFELHAYFSVEGNRPIDVVRRAVESVDDSPAIDILIDHKLSVVDVSRKKFGTGWTISENNDFVNVYVNDLFSQHAVTLRIDSSIVIEGAALLRENGVESGRLFYATPSRDFRFCVFCPLAEVYSAEDLLAKTQVEFCVRIPKFIDEHVNPFTGLKIDLDSKQSNSSALCHVSKGSQNNLTSLDLGKSTEFTHHDLLAHLPFDASQPLSPRNIYEHSVSVGQIEQNDVVEFDGNCDTASTTSAIFGRSNKSLQAYTESEEVFCKSRATGFDITVCVLLDEKVDTAMAAAAFFSRELADTDLLAEIGLWRHRFKSAFSRFVPIYDIFELAHLPMSDHDLQKMEAFLTRLRGNTNAQGLTVVIGEEMLDADSSRALTNIIGEKFNSVQLIAVGQSDLYLSARWSGLSQFAEISASCSFLVEVDSLVGQSAVVDKLSGLRYFYLPPYLKQSILMAESKGFASEKIRELAPQILKDQ